MEPLLSMTGEVHPCFTFYQRMLNWVQTEPLYKKMCSHKMEDYVEWKSRKKYHMQKNFFETELHKLKIYSIPEYDEATDSFKDGPLPDNADGYFSLSEEKQTYYSQPQ